MGKLIDLKGQKYGNLIVVKKTQNRACNGAVKWVCKCDCGNIIEVSSNSLRAGRSKSCGCMRNGENLRNIKGKKIGRLTAVSPLRSTGNGVVWLCKCDCGNYTELATGAFNAGTTLSCGCLNRETFKEKQAKNSVLSTNIYNIKRDDAVLRTTNTSGFTGVCYIKQKKKYQASICFQNFSYKKTFDTLEEAIDFRKIMKTRRDKFVEWYFSLTSEELEEIKNLHTSHKDEFRRIFKEYMNTGDFPYLILNDTTEEKEK